MRRLRTTVAADDGVTLATETTTWGSPPYRRVVAMHATGFCKEVWNPIIADLRSMVGSGSVQTADQRGHGDSAPFDFPLDWWHLGSDVITVVDGGRGLIGVGHSAGGAAIVMAELISPGTFSRMLLIEPILPPPPYTRPSSTHPLISKALRRHDTFADRPAAAAELAEKATFFAWDRRILDAYVGHALIPSGGALVLKCARETEAECYSAAYAHGAYDRLGEVACPVDLVVGDSSEAISVEAATELANRFGDAGLEIIEGASHFVAMERPDVVAVRLAALMTDTVP